MASLDSNETRIGTRSRAVLRNSRVQHIALNIAVVSVYMLGMRKLCPLTCKFANVVVGIVDRRRW